MTLKFSTKAIDIQKSKADLSVIFTLNSQLESSAQALDNTHAKIFTQALKKTKLKSGETYSATLLNSTSKNYQSVLLAQLTEGKKDPLSALKLQQSIAKIAKKVLETKAKDISIYIDDLAHSELSTNTLSKIIAKEFERCHYRYLTTFGEKSAKTATAINISLINSNAAEAKAIRSGMAEGTALAKGINFARELGNLPGNYCTPVHLSGFAKELAKQEPKLTVKVLGESALEKLKMGSMLSVGRGSSEETQLIVLEYKGKASAKPNVLVGKGITFDTGGISLKPGPSMDEMKFDMCGAASVLGTFKALVEMKAKAHVIGIIAAAENMPAGNATKPGDVVTSMSGKTIEVLNTDAEGRLVLCDALTYAERFKPKSVIDIATLTGACVIALGSHASGLFSNDQALADKLLACGEACGDRAWQLPIWDEYHNSLKSNFADMANIGSREAGSVTAACFLSKFTESYPWAHIDIAGSAWNSGANKGATGRPVELLVNYLVNNA